MAVLVAEGQLVAGSSSLEMSSQGTCTLNVGAFREADETFFADFNDFRAVLFCTEVLNVDAEPDDFTCLALRKGRKILRAGTGGTESSSSRVRSMHSGDVAAGLEGPGTGLEDFAEVRRRRFTEGTASSSESVLTTMMSSGATVGASWLADAGCEGPANSADSRPTRYSSVGAGEAGDATCPVS